MFALMILWGLFVFYGLPAAATTSSEMIATFGWSMVTLLVSFIILLVLCSVVKKFGKWCDHKLF